MKLAGAERTARSATGEASELSARLGHVDVINLARWGRNGKAVFAQTFDMEFDGLTDLCLSLGDRCPGRDAARKIGNIGGIIVLRLLDYHSVTHLEPHFFSPACLRILPSVPIARSSLGLPGTVTRPDLLGA